MGLFFSRPTTNPGPREPDLGCGSLELDDSELELATSYMEVTYPPALRDVRVVPASPNSSWLNLVFNDHKDNRNTEPPNQGVEGIYMSTRLTPRTQRVSTAPESLMPPPQNLAGFTMSSPAQNSILTLSMEQRRSRGVAIADILQQLITELVDTINPSEAAYSLYGFGIISVSERDAATMESIDRKQRSNTLIKNLIIKLKENPHWFKDTCKALENTGTQSVIEKLRAMVKEKSDIIDIEDTSKFNFDADSLTGEGIHSGRAADGGDDDVVLMFASSQLAELDQAYKSGGQDAVRQVLQSQSMEQNNQLLQDACREGMDTSILELLLSESPSSCDVNGRDKHGRTCLHTICASFPKGKDAAIRFRTEEQLMKLWKLLDSGADSRIQDEDGNTALHMAISSGNLEVSKVLLKHTPDLVNIQNTDGLTVLHITTMNHLPALTAELVKTKCCNPYLYDKEEKTPLHYASSSGMLDLVEPLVGKSRSTDFVNAPDSNGDTALHTAAEKGDKKVVKVLLKHGADDSLKNNNDQTAFDVASDRRNYKVIKALLKKKYPVRWRFKLQKLNSKRGSSMTRLPMATSPSTNSVNSDADSSVCSEINVTTSELDLDGVDD